MLINLQIAYLSFLRFFAYPWEIFFIILRRVFEVVLMAIFWNIVSAQDGGIMGQELIAYFLISNGINELVMGRSLELGMRIRDLIQSGDLNNYMLKPTLTLPAIYASVFGGKGMNNILGLISIIIGILLLPKTTFESILLFVPVMLFAMVIGFGINLLVGTVALHILDEIGPIRSLVQNLIRICSGLVVPFYLFSKDIQDALNLTPFPYLIYAPINVLKQKSFTIEYMLVMIIWAIVLLVVSVSWWNWSLKKKYEATGL